MGRIKEYTIILKGQYRIEVLKGDVLIGTHHIKRGDLKLEAEKYFLKLINRKIGENDKEYKKLRAVSNLLSYSTYQEIK